MRRRGRILFTRQDRSHGANFCDGVKQFLAERGEQLGEFVHNPQVCIDASKPLSRARARVDSSALASARPRHPLGAFGLSENVLRRVEDTL